MYKNRKTVNIDEEIYQEFYKVVKGEGESVRRVLQGLAKGYAKAVKNGGAVLFLDGKSYTSLKRQCTLDDDPSEKVGEIIQKVESDKVFSL